MYICIQFLSWTCTDRAWSQGNNPGKDPTYHTPKCWTTAFWQGLSKNHSQRQASESWKRRNTKSGKRIPIPLDYLVFLTPILTHLAQSLWIHRSFLPHYCCNPDIYQVSFVGIETTKVSCKTCWVLRRPARVIIKCGDLVFAFQSEDKLASTYCRLTLSVVSGLVCSHLEEESQPRSRSNE